MEGESLDTGNSGVGEWEFSPCMSGKAMASGQRKKIVVSLGITGRGKRNSSERTGAERVRGGVVFEYLSVGADFEAHVVEIGSADAGNDAGGAEGGRYAVDPRELVEATERVGHHVLHEEARESAER